MKMKYSVFFGVLAAASFLFAGYEDQQPNDPKYYDNAKVVRIKYVEGEGFIQRSYDEGNEEATVNLPVFENDSVGTTSGRLELYLGRLNYLRLDNDTFIQLSKIPQLRKTDLNFRIEKGGIYLDIENLDAEKAIEIQTPDCGIFLLNRGSTGSTSRRTGKRRCTSMTEPSRFPEESQAGMSGKTRKSSWKRAKSPKGLSIFTIPTRTTSTTGTTSATSPRPTCITVHPSICRTGTKMTNTNCRVPDGGST